MAEHPVLAGVIAPLDFEAAAFASQPPGASGLGLEICGIGGVAADRAARRLLARGVSLLVSFGTAGALGKGCAGDIVVPERVVDSAGQAFNAPPELIDVFCRALSGPPIPLRGMLLSADQALSDPAAKQRMHAETGAEAVDLESAAVARVAAGHVPFLAIRVIIDAADRSIPDAAMSSVEGSSHRLRRVLPALLKSPDQIPAMISLGLASRRAARSMRLCAEALTKSMSDPTFTGLISDSTSGQYRR